MYILFKYQKNIYFDLKHTLKILIIRLSSIGDVILTTPLVRSLRHKFRDAQIDFVIKKSFAEVMETNPHINHLYIFDKNVKNDLHRMRNEIQSANYDWVIDIHKNFRSVYLRHGAKNGIVTTYNKQVFHRTLLVWFGINRYRDVKPVFLRYFEAVKNFQVEWDKKYTELVISDKELNEVRDILLKRKCDFNKPLIAICPGASFKNKQWKMEGFAEVADYFVEKQNAGIVFLGGKNDAGLCRTIQHKMKHSSIDVAGELSLRKSAAVLKISQLVFTNDSGLMHVAQSQKKPVVAIFGPTVRELGYFPFPQYSTVIEKLLKCRPCTHNGLNHCPKKHFKCMNEISSKEVIEAGEKLLKTNENIL